MGLFDFLSSTAKGASTPEPTSLLEQHLCLCRKTKSVGIDCGPGIWIVCSHKPQAGNVDVWPASEREIREALGWSQEHLLQTVVEYLKTQHRRARQADYLLCRILNECERRLGQPVSAHPFTEDIEVVLGREPLVKSAISVADPEKIIAFLRDKYSLGDTVITGRAHDLAGEAARLLRPILAGLKRHSRFLYFEVDNEPLNDGRKAQAINCWLDYTVIHARFAHVDAPITLCVFSHSCPHDREDAYYILATHHPKIIDYLRSHAGMGG